MIEKTTRIRNKLGLHARAASKLVQLAQEFSSNVTVSHGEQTANGKSIMSVLILQATFDTEIRVRVEGEDESEAIEAIVDLIEDRFGESE